jgi:hypothetical protein
MGCRFLDTEWFASIVQHVHNHPKVVPPGHDSQAFFDCIAIVLESCLRNLALRSLQEISDAFLNHKLAGAEFPGFVVRIVAKEGKAVFDPDFSAVEKAATKAVNNIIKTCSSFPRVETKLHETSVDRLLTPDISKVRV